MTDCEREFDFTLLLDGVFDANEETVNALYEAGCDDATVSVRCGRVCMTFSRLASSLQEAIITAIQSVLGAGIGARVLRVDECNLVTQAEIARKIGRSRQMVHQYIVGARGPGRFPPPACNVSDGSDGVSLWYWCEVACWLFSNDIVREEVERTARELALINNMLEFCFLRNIDPNVTDRFMVRASELGLPGWCS